GQDYDRVFADSLRDRWFSAEAALTYGLIDRIVDSPSDLFAPMGTGRPLGLSQAGVRS
ncbi:ATP-dependent Clp protease proteolytic subunit, partial [Burkholderia multivorans]